MSPSGFRGNQAALPREPGLRSLVLVLGDQLWMDNPALAGFDPAQDRVLMIEAPGEGAQVSVLGYHNFITGKSHEPMQVNIDHFRRQMQALKDAKVTVISRTTATPSRTRRLRSVTTYQRIS